MEALDIVLLCEATAALARLDERLGTSSAPVRAGWLARALLHEAAACARLSEVFVEAQDLLLFEHDLLLRLSDHDVLAAHRGLVFLRAAARRDPRHLFTPRRLTAAARLRFRGSGVDAGEPAWVRDRAAQRRADPEEIRASLDQALDPHALQGLRMSPALAGAADFLARWHTSRADSAVGRTIGLGLAGSWLRREGLVRLPVALPASGFVGHAAEHVPRAGDAWTNRFVAAALRGAEWGLGLVGRLERAERILREALTPRRITSRGPEAVDLLISSPGVTASGMARTLAISGTAARGLLHRVGSFYPLIELTGRGSFRLFSLP